MPDYSHLRPVSVLDYYVEEPVEEIVKVDMALLGEFQGVQRFTPEMELLYADTLTTLFVLGVAFASWILHLLSFCGFAGASRQIGPRCKFSTLLGRKRARTR